MDSPPLYKLPEDTLHTIFLSLPLRQIIICRSISKPIYSLLTSSSFLHLLSLRRHPPLSLLALRHHHHHHHSSPPPPSLLAFDTLSNTWLSFSLSFIPFLSLSPLTSSSGSLYLWAHTGSTRSLVVCNPLNHTFRVLPALGSAWSKHGSVLAGSGNRVLVLTELATLYFNGDVGDNVWLKFSSNLPAKPRSPVLMGESVYALCDVGSPWRSVWMMFRCRLPEFGKTGLVWSKMERSEWGDVFDVLKRPRLVKGVGNKILMVGGLKSQFSLNATILILRLDMESLEWDEAGRMPIDMYKCFQESSKFKVFGSGDKVCFSAKRVNKLALWDSSSYGLSVGRWRWIDGPPGFGDALFRGFVFDARLDVVP